ncbi:MAG: diguanylate cyclase [Clostridia bacterium]
MNVGTSEHPSDTTDILELIKQRDMMRQYLDIATTMFLVMDCNLIVRLVNKRASELLGYEEQEILGEKWVDRFIPSKEKSRVKKILSSICNGDLLHESAENHILSKDGELHLIVWKNTPVKDENGNIAGILSSGEDITKRRSIEKEVRQNAKRNATLIQILQSRGKHPEEVLSNTLHQAIKLTHSETGCIYLFDSQTGRFELKAHKYDNPTADAQTQLARIRATANNKPVVSGPFLWVPIRVRSSTVAWICVAKKNRRFHENDIWQLTLLMNCALDVIGSIQADQQLKQEKDYLRVTLSSVENGVISTDRIGLVRNMSRSAEEYTGVKEKDAFGRPLSQIFRLSGGKDILSAVINHGETLAFSEELLQSQKTDLQIIIQGKASPIKDHTGNILGMVVVFSDITEDIRRNKEIEYLSYHDPLTGLYNRRFFEEEVKRLDTARNYPLTLVMSDVNGLKLANDAYGHQTGDLLLKKISHIIKEGCRADDIIARFGGDELTMLLPRTTPEQAKAMIHRIQQQLSKESVDSIPLSASFGCHTKIKKEEEIHDVLHKAEDEMYHSKLHESPAMKKKALSMMMNTLYERCSREKDHSLSVSQFCLKMGMALNLGKKELNELRVLGTMHDIGKIAIKDEILNKATSLSHDEWDEIQRHAEIGYRILSSINEFSEIAIYVLAHHENWDGSGYPKGLKNRQIPLQSRIVQLAEAYDDMMNSHPYRETLGHDTAIRNLQLNAGKQFDPELSKIFIEKILNETWSD